MHQALDRSPIQEITGLGYDWTKAYEISANELVSGTIHLGDASHSNRPRTHIIVGMGASALLCLDRYHWLGSVTKSHTSKVQICWRRSSSRTRRHASLSEVCMCVLQYGLV